jgi:hypothetical protein
MRSTPRFFESPFSRRGAQLDKEDRVSPKDALSFHAGPVTSFQFHAGAEPDCGLVRLYADDAECSETKLLFLQTATPQILDTKTVSEHDCLHWAQPRANPESAAPSNGVGDVAIKTK